MRHLLAGTLLLTPSLAHQATTYGEEGAGGNLTGVAVFSAVFLAALFATAWIGLRQARRRGRREVLWAVFPTVVVAAVGAMVGAAIWSYKPVGGAALVLELTAHRYWWGLSYPELGMQSAGEGWIPVGARVEIRARSQDLFYSLSVPGLELTMDAVPGQTTRAWVQARKPGVYGGVQSEYVGPATDKMRLRLLALPEARFQALVTAAQNFEPPEPPPVFLARCAACHTVRGTEAQGALGPDLTLFALRTTFGSGVWPNREAFLRPWIQNAPGMKPGVKMPAFPDLTEKELKTLLAYLKRLGPEGFDFTDLIRVEGP